MTERQRQPLIGQSTGETGRTPERINPHDVAVVTATFYPGWYPGSVRGEQNSDKIRGDLALQTVVQAINCDYHLVLVDGTGEESAFRQELLRREIPVYDETEKGMSGSRRQGFRTAGALNAQVIAWLEPEKVSMVEQLSTAAAPILRGEADIVVPKRDDAAFATYPDYQVVDEQRSNRVFNDILKKRGLIDPAAEDLDAWFGPKLFRNIPEIRNLLLGQYKYEGTLVSKLVRGESEEVRTKHEKELGQIYNPDLWAAALMLPIPRALHQGYRVVSVPVTYQHPTEQTALEIDPEQKEFFERKRDIQRKSVLNATAALVKILEQDPTTRLHIVHHKSPNSLL